MRRGVAKEFWGKRPHHAQAGYEEVYVEVMKLLPKNKGIRFLDLGCGIGNLEKFLWEEGYTNILAVNHSEKLLEIARKNLPQYKYQIMDVSRPFCFDDNSFDVVACLEVLQHNKNPFEVLSEAIRVGKKVILSIPNGFWSELRTSTVKRSLVFLILFILLRLYLGMPYIILGEKLRCGIIIMESGEQLGKFIRGF